MVYGIPFWNRAIRGTIEFGAVAREDLRGESRKGFSHQVANGIELEKFVDIDWRRPVVLHHYEEAEGHERAPGFGFAEARIEGDFVNLENIRDSCFEFVHGITKEKGIYVNERGI